MILVDVEAPVMGKTYDFQIDGGIPVNIVARQMRDMICMKEQCDYCGNEDSLTLWDIRGERLMPGDKTADECGIITGMSLMLV